MLPLLGFPKCIAIYTGGDVNPPHDQYYLCTLQQQEGSMIDEPARHDADAEAQDSEFFGEVNQVDGGLNRPHVRFYIEPSKKHEKLVHVRCFNKKYWVPQRVDDVYEHFIMGTTDEPDENLSNPSCTLFELNLEADLLSKDFIKASFLHSGLRQYADVAHRIDKEGEPKEKRPRDFFRLWKDKHALHVYDLSKHVVLPRYVCFQGNNGKYLRLQDDDHLEFTASEFADPRVICTVINNNDGTVCIMSNYKGRYWEVDATKDGQRWIRVNKAKVDRTRPAMIFKVAKVGHYFTLKNVGYMDYLCSRVDGSMLGVDISMVKNNNTAAETADTVSIIPEEAKLMLAEPVTSREIYNVVYYGTDSPRIYGDTDLSMLAASAINTSAKESSKVKLSLKLTQTETRTWDTSVSHKAGVSTTIEFGIPKIDSVSIQFDYEFSKSFSWGTVEQKQKEQNVEYEVTVPPRKKVTVSAVAKQAKCDIPFSYTQKDTLYNGVVETTYHDDGMFTGMNSFNIEYVTKEEDLKIKA